MDLINAVCKHIWNMNFPAFVWTLFYVFSLHFDVFLLFFCYGKLVWSFVYVIICCVSAEITTLMSISDKLDPYSFCRKIKETRSVKGEMDGEVFISRQSRHFSFIYNMIKVLFPICTLTWRVNNYVSRQEEDINRRNESTIFVILIVPFSFVLNLISLTICICWNPFPS